MMAVHGRALGELLIGQGLCPPNARCVELHVQANDAIFLRYEVFVSSADLPKIAAALIELAADRPYDENGGSGTTPPPPLTPTK